MFISSCKLIINVYNLIEASHLDTWVFDHVKELFKNASTNPELDNMLRQKKIVFFLHLLGLDTNGHGFRPSSKEYLENIRLVDNGVKEIVDVIEDFYQHDGRTSYIFTADHGMNNRGKYIQCRSSFIVTSSLCTQVVMVMVILTTHVPLL
jgi:predicted AlkP superfamily pyrophosphatase or phosphodiesterase